MQSLTKNWIFCQIFQTADISGYEGSSPPGTAEKGGNHLQIGMTELILVFIVALFALGPDRLPVYARKLGEAVLQFRKYSEEAAREIKESVVEPLEEAQAPLRDAAKPLENLDKTVRGSVKEVKESFAGIGKPKKAADETAAPEPSPPDREPEAEPTSI